jgi:hypothetical protein
LTAVRTLVCDQHVGVLQSADAGKRDPSELRVVGDDDHFSCALDQGAIGVRLHLVVRRTTRLDRHAVDTHEGDVEIQVGEVRFGERSDELE